VYVIVSSDNALTSGEFELEQNIRYGGDGGADGGAPPVDAGPPPAVIAVGETAHGKTYPEWIVAWTRWIFSIPKNQNPGIYLDAAYCTLGQSGDVWFLSGVFLGTGFFSRACTIPAGKAIFFPIAFYFSDYPCPDPGFAPASGQSLEDFLLQDARHYVDRVTTLGVYVDGNSLSPPLNPFLHRAHSALFDFVAEATLDIDSCFTHTTQQGVADGYWILMEPFSRGAHTLRFLSQDSIGTQTTVEYQLTVE
jgi:hypothetical protein